MTEEERSADVPECGRRLRQTREQLGLSVDDIASELRLSGFQIRALENDDWADLPGTTYARGYLRSYARLLGLDADQLLAGASTEEIEISRTEPALDNRVVPSGAAPATGTSRRRWGWVLGVVLLGAVVVALWRSPLGRQLAPDLTMMQAPSTDSEMAQQRAGDGTAGAGTEQPSLEADGAAGGQYSTVTSEGASDQPPMPTQPDRMVFQFDERSWVDVRDARGQRLLYRAFQAGRRIQVEGQPPFRIYLGNARGVRLEYLGDTITPKTASGRLFARLVVGGPTG
ncbi:MAG: RodZ domain-containing protein [Arenicellales bacterium]|jgi:cytoskeleton protein RodZ